MLREFTFISLKMLIEEDHQRKARLLRELRLLEGRLVPMYERESINNDSHQPDGEPS